MAVSKSVRRLLRVLDLEEELRRRELESAQAEQARLGVALTVAAQQERDGRLLFANGVQREDSADRWMGLNEVDACRRRRAVLQQYIQQSIQAIETLRAALLEKRVERKQAETLVKAAEARESLEEGRRTQQSLDTWYLMRQPSGNVAENVYEVKGSDPVLTDIASLDNLRATSKDFSSKLKTGL